MSHLDGVFPCRLWRAHAGRRTDFLGCHTPGSSPEIRPAGRPSLTHRRPCSGPTWAGSCSVRPTITTPPHVEVRPRPGEAQVLYLAQQLALGAAGRAGRHPFSPSRSAMLCWGIFLRVTVGLHSTWRSILLPTCLAIARSKPGTIRRNNWWVALFTFGEGWHNNHHAHASSCRHGLAWYEFDPSWLLLCVLKFFRCYLGPEGGQAAQSCNRRNEKPPKARRPRAYC